MTVTIKPKFPAQFDYAGTFFKDLEIAVVTAEEMERLGLRSLATASDAERRHPSAWVHKTYWYSDRRYNPARRSWKLDDLIEELERAASFGPVTAKQNEQHAAFEIERSRPEDEVVRVNRGGVALNGWTNEPLYKLGRFETLPAAIATLKEVQAYLRSGNV